MKILKLKLKHLFSALKNERKKTRRLNEARNCSKHVLFKRNFAGIFAFLIMCTHILYVVSSKWTVSRNFLALFFAQKTLAGSHEQAKTVW